MSDMVYLADTLDVGVYHLEVVERFVRSNSFASLDFVLAVVVGSDKVQLSPNASAKTQDYGINVYLSVDEQLNTTHDLEVGNIQI